jgi:hypothetical protein
MTTTAPLSHRQLPHFSLDAIRASGKMTECPLEEQYLFHRECSIITCKYHSTSVSSRCYLIAGRNAPTLLEDGRISDNDLLRWRGGVLNLSDSLQIRAAKREAVKAVNCILVLDRYLRYLDKFHPFCSLQRPSAEIVAKDFLRHHFPFTIDDLDYESWMAIYMFAEEVFVDFQDFIDANLSVPRYNKTDGKKIKLFKSKTRDLTLSDLCFIKRPVWEEYRNQVISSNKTSLF